MDGKVLMDELTGVMSRLVVRPRWAAEMLALWMLHTYAFELRDGTAYIGLESPQPRCGKSTLVIDWPSW